MTDVDYRGTSAGAASRLRDTAEELNWLAERDDQALTPGECVAFADALGEMKGVHRLLTRAAVARVLAPEEAERLADLMCPAAPQPEFSSADFGAVARTALFCLVSPLVMACIMIAAGFRVPDEVSPVLSNAAVGLGFGYVVMMWLVRGIRARAVRLAEFRAALGSAKADLQDGDFRPDDLS